MKQWRKLVAVVGIAFITGGCGNKTTAQDTVQEEIIHYLEQTNEIAHIKNEAIATYNDICANAEEMDKEELIQCLQDDVLSKLEQYETELENVVVNSMELEGLKSELKQVIIEQKQDVEDTIKALEEYNTSAIDDINLSIEENKKAYEEYMEQLKQYAKEYSIQVVEE